MLIDQFAPKNEHLIAKYMPRFAAIENQNARKKWGFGSAKQDGTPKKIAKAGGIKKKPINKKTMDRVSRLHKKGLTQDAIAKQLELSVYATQRYFAELNIGRIDKASLPRKAQLVLDMMSYSMNLAKIAMFVDMTEEEVQLMIDEYNLWNAGPANHNNTQKSLSFQYQKKAKVGLALRLDNNNDKNENVQPQ